MIVQQVPGAEVTGETGRKSKSVIRSTAHNLFVCLQITIEFKRHIMVYFIHLLLDSNRIGHDPILSYPITIQQ